MSFWTEEKLAQLRRLRLLGFGECTIAKRLGTTKNAVHGKLWRMKAPPVARTEPAHQPERVERRRDNWDFKLTESWADRKKRRAA